MNGNVISSSDIDRGLVDGLILLFKASGETPLEALGKLKVRFPILREVPLSYAGRLDPSASGLLLVLSGSFNKMRSSYLGLPKTYKIKVLFGISTDTGDFLGLINDKKAVEVKDRTFIDENPENFNNILSSLKGEYDLPYPSYSSKTVDGKALHQWAREGAIGDIEIPKQKSKIDSIELLSTKNVKGDEIVERAIAAVCSVNGDFRQNEITSCWNEFKTKYAESTFVEVELKIKCGSGTYMRSFAEQLGKRCGTVALASSIIREKVDEFDIEDAIILA